MMSFQRACVFFGVSAAAVMTVIVPIRDDAIRRLSASDELDRATAALARIVLPPEADVPDLKLDAETAKLVEGGVDSVQTGSPGSALQSASRDVSATLENTENPPAVPPAASVENLPNAEPIPVSAAALAYRKGDVAALAALAKSANSSGERAALEWAALRSDQHPSMSALSAFLQAHPNWVGAGWTRYRQEAELLVHPPAPRAVADFFAAEPPQSSAGKLAAARAAAALGRLDDSFRLVRALWRDETFDAWTESLILREFGAALTKADHKFRADRLLYAENFAAAFRAAALAGPDVTALAQARFAAARGPLGVALVKAVPNSLKSDPGFLFARIQDARRSGRAYEAATLLDLAPTDREALINPDKWWTERRMVARELLDLKEPQLAFKICGEAARPDDPAAQVDAAFHAGWIALRFLGDAPEAAKRFALAAEAAETPLAIARAAYWRGRAAEAMGNIEEAALNYQSAASEPVAYYGQLAADRLGVKRLTLREPTSTAEGDARDEAVRAAEALYALGIDDLATALAFEAARQWRDEAQLAAMGEVVKLHADSATLLQFGKIAMLRGYAFDAMAFPSAGVPAYLPLAHSADLASVYAVARQESEFVWHAASGAGAKGLMQILPSTAASTAQRAGVAFDYARLVVDPAFNTQLGAAFLGQLIEDVGGSRELAFAAYNAGGGRVAQWIAAYGDPRNGTADPVDWVERIPFDETRDYVERVSENLGVYRQRLSEDPPTNTTVSPRLARD